jgi:periplasmic divalent cation tolerance protein
MSKKLLVMVSCPGEEVAHDIARTLMEERLIACAQVTAPVMSVYRWRGEVEESLESLLLAKTREQLFEGVRQRVRELHPYEVPEIVAVDLAHGDREYMEWIEEVTGGTE